MALMPTIALILSAIMTTANFGIHDEFLTRWMRSFLTSMVVLPLVLATLGLVERGVCVLLGTSVPVLARKLVVALCTAVVIESVLAIAVTVVSGPPGVSFGQGWWASFSRALPVGFLIGLFMTFYMKPKLDRLRQSAA